MRRLGAVLLGSLMGSAFAQTPLPEPALRFQVPAEWSRLDFTWRRTPLPGMRTFQQPKRAAVVEVLGRDPEAADRLIRMRLEGQAREAVQFSPGSLLGSELGAFMTAASSARPDFSKALLDATLDYWMPRPFHLEGLTFEAGRFSLGVSADTSRRGPVGR